MSGMSDVVLDSTVAVRDVYKRTHDWNEISIPSSLSSDKRGGMHYETIFFETYAVYVGKYPKRGLKAQ